MKDTIHVGVYIDKNLNEPVEEETYGGEKKILYIVEAMGGGAFTYIVDLANVLVVCFAPGADYEYTFSKGGMSLTFRE